ncbi:type III secretion system cytoplasmic ring protein SctQ [Pseudomonas frederiksbergensis]|uniref:type III secretion system cytoplasmic ring protein SctQ n=1 Tax=Pseudomonas frederiksbergensis TaxID=104087 RepID=UPI003D1E3533
MTITYGIGAGDGLIMHAQVLDQPVRLWFAPHAWCHWISPVLEVPDWSAVPPELHAVLASWTLASAGIALENSTIAWPTAPTLEAATVKTAPYWCLRFEHKDRRLDAWVLEAPVQWIDSLSEVFLAIDMNNDCGNRTLPVALIAGWSYLDQHTLERLQPGDGLLLHHTYRVSDGQLGLFLTRPLATLSTHGTTTLTLEAVMDDVNDWLDAFPAPCESNAPQGNTFLLTVVAQVATFEVPLHQLAHLRVGDVLEGPTHADHIVTLKVAGKPIAHGLLLEIDGRLAVRIDRLL